MTIVVNIWAVPSKMNHLCKLKFWFVVASWSYHARMFTVWLWSWCPAQQGILSYVASTTWEWKQDKWQANFGTSIVAGRAINSEARTSSAVKRPRRGSCTYVHVEEACGAAKQQPAAAERKRNATTSSSSSSALSFSLVRPASADPRPAPDRLGSRLPAPHQTSKAWKRKDRWETEDGTGGENVMMPGLTRLDARARVRGLRQLLSRYASRPTACPPLALAPTSDWADSSSLSELLPPPQPAASASACVRAGHHHARHATPRPAVLAASSVSPIHP